MQEYNMKLRSTRENTLEVEKLADIAESCYIEQEEKWR